MLKKKKSEKQPLEKRSPLQNLNTLHFLKSTLKNSSNLSSSSSAEARNGCLRFLRSSNSSSDASLPPSSSRKPKSLPKVAAANVSAKLFRSKENELPKKKQQLGNHRRENREPKRNPICKTTERSKLSCGKGNPLKILEGRKLKSDCTPVGSSGVRRNAAEDSGSRKANDGSAASVKTPPVEASVSPEIQSKMMVSKSAATPVCYGAGHLLSGVTDKRKCRRRGSLRGGCEKINLFDDEKSDQNVVDDLQDCLVPLPAEASVRWLLSPCNEGREDQGSDSEMKVGECEMSCGNASLELDLLSSPSILCGNASELGYDSSDFRGSGSVHGVVKEKEARIFMLSPQEDVGFKCFLGNLDKKMCDSFIAATPNSISNCVSVGLGEGKGVSGNSSSVSLGSLSSGNIIQTPNSSSSSYECIRRLNVEAGHRSSVSFELGSIKKEIPDAVRFSSRSEMSSCTSENLTLSQMRISWRDGLEGRIDENDELDCCPCLSDEEVDAVGCSDQHLKPYQLPQEVGGKEDTYKDDDRWRDSDVSPILLEYEPCISAVPKKKSPEDRLDACAESICTNAGDLAVSCDSDWTHIEGSHSFQVK